MSAAEKGAGAGNAILTRLSEDIATIMNRFEAIESKIDRLAKHLGADKPASNGSAGGTVATVMQIQGEHGDPEVGRPPKNWSGPSYEGSRASECPPDFLDFYADFLDWKGANPRAGKEKYAKYDILNASRCRRWAVEIREGRHKQSAPAPQRMAPPPDPETSWRGNDGGLPPPPVDDGFGPPPGDDDSLPF